MTAPRLDRAALLVDLKRQVTLVEEDLNDQLDRGELPEQLAELKAQHDAVTKASRSATTFISWRSEQVTQSAVAWVLGTVFVRWCEDNELISSVLSGSGDRLGDAQDAHNAFFREFPHKTNRHWLEACFDQLKRSDAGAMLFDEKHNPAYWIPVSHDGAKELIRFWRTRRGDSNTVVHDFQDPGWDTRFLGDLYQDLSQDAKDRYALLQTPKFVEKFILDYTLKPALDEFPLEGFRLIDPTCGSGHFLLGAFYRLAKAWEEQDSRLNPSEIARRALDSVHGVDLNPFAVAIARFRLMAEAWKFAGVTTVDQAAGQRWTMTVAVGDSLLAGKRGSFEDIDEEVGLRLRSEDVHEFPTLLDEGSYHAVVGNPPYITVKDSALNTEYRRHYSSCHRQFQLTVPFAQRFFELARAADNDGRGSGFVGQITSNAFMKREFGSKLIEEFFPKVDLTHVVDTSGVYIPGHGTPTVILFGKNQKPDLGGNVRAVLGIRGEPTQPVDPEKGEVWSAIVRQIDSPGSESEWVSVADLARRRFLAHPWSLSGGGADQLLVLVEGSHSRISKLVRGVGFAAITGEDDAFEFPQRVLDRAGVSDSRPFGKGDAVRDWICSPTSSVPWMYEDDLTLSGPPRSTILKRLFWRNRLHLTVRKRFGVPIKDVSGVEWWEYREFYRSKFEGELAVVFAEVATHNHFILDRGGKVFKQTAPVIKLFEAAGEMDYLGLVGVLNSSLGCFWLKQACFPKGGSGIGRGIQPEDWMERYAFNGSNVEDFPLPPLLPIERASRIDGNSIELSSSTPRVVTQNVVPSRERLERAHSVYVRARARMIAEQEELDWDMYQRYGLLSESEAAAVVVPDPATVPELNLGERAFEIVLARQMDGDNVKTQWFARHGSTPIVDIPEYWPESYRQVVQARIDLIEKRRDIALIERPECKRRWSAESWESQQERALREWLQDRLEAKHLWFAEDENGAMQPAPRSTADLADLMRSDEEFAGVAALWATDTFGRPDVDMAEIVAALIDEEHVPFLAAYRYKGKGLAIRADWERVWDLQRKEDAIAAELGHDVTRPEVRMAVKERLGTIPVPPKYGSGDFLRPSYWRHRGKLDVPKERFISYPGATRDGDGSLLLGWAGWDHQQQAHALAVLIAHRRAEEGWPRDRMKPLLAGLAELMPWVRQWHGEIDPAFGTSPAEAYDGFLDGQLAELELSLTELRGWKPEGRVDVSPLPNRKRAGDTLRKPRVKAAPDPAHIEAVLEFGAGGPFTTAQVGKLLGVSAAVARSLVKHLLDRGDLVQTGERRGVKYHLAD